MASGTLHIFVSIVNPAPMFSCVGQSCQLDEIKNHFGNKLLGRSVREFLRMD